MTRFLSGLWRLTWQIPLVLLAPVFLTFSALAMFTSDVLFSLFGRRKQPDNRAPNATTASVVIPNWNGRDLLAKYLPSVVAALEPFPASEVIVVDNGSTDGSAEFLRSKFPTVRLLALPENLGFGGGSNAGFAAAKNDIVILLNSDMRVDKNFVQPLLDGFTDPLVFGVSCQILFTDPKKLRQETGLTEGWWSQGAVRVRHRMDENIKTLYPCFYGGGGSCAFDRRKFLEVGGFDPLYHPFYLEDTDLGYVAWKRGWKILYQPASLVYHEHRGTIGKKFSEAYIQGVLKKNFLLFTWKNVHTWKWILPHLAHTWAAAMLTWLFGDSPERTSPLGIARAFLNLPQALQARANAHRFAQMDDCEAFRRPLGGHFRDTFGDLAGKPERLRVLFVAPYPICPPVHGGGVFMYQTVRELAKLCELHLIVLLDYEKERKAHQELDQICASTHYIVRIEGRQKMLGSMEPHAVREFRNVDLAWAIHRTIYLSNIDVLQLEYTVLGQYAGRYRHVPSILFEHDVYFQSIARRLPFMTSAMERVSARWEYLRSLRYELRLLERPDRIQVCSEDNARYLESFLPHLHGKIDAGYRAGIDTSLYSYTLDGREPFTLLFLGSFRHLPNVEALAWFVNDVFPLIRAQEPRARLVVVGSDPPPRHSLRESEAIDLIGFVEDVQEPLRRYGLFMCPILSGSGVRVKLLEAFAAGIPVVSTRLGAEGLAEKDGEICALADDPQGFANHVLALLADPTRARQMAARARTEIETRRDMRVMTERMVESYRSEVSRMRAN